MRALDDTTVFEGTAGNGTTFEAAGVSFLYLIRESAGGDYSEVLTTRGPLSQPLVVEVSLAQYWVYKPIVCLT